MPKSDNIRPSVEHPTPEQLYSFATGSYPNDSLYWVADHVASCDQCMNLLEAAPDDTLVDLIRSCNMGPSPVMRLKKGYRIERELGRGGMGIVYLAEEPELQRKVALKMITRGAHSDPRDLARFRREAKAAATLTHPCIAQIYDVGDQEGEPYIAMEWIEGSTLAVYLEEKSVPLPCVVGLMINLAEATHHAHLKGVIHRDLKPSNILIAKDEADGLQPKIVDFGLAKHIQSEEAATATGVLMGTPKYMSPEQAAANHAEVGARSDIFSLGVILYECMTRHCPFEGANSIEILEQVKNADPQSPRVWRPSIPRDLETICLKCLEKRPEARYASCSDLSADLKRFREGIPILARPQSLLSQALRYGRRHPTIFTLITCVSLAAITLLTSSLAYNNSLSTALNEQRIEGEHAHKNLQLALEAIDKTLEQVGFEQLANQPGMEKVREELLAKAVTLYSSILESYPKSELDSRSRTKELKDRAVRQYANALSKLGRIQTLLGNKKEAQKNIHEAMSYQRRLREHNSTLLELTHELAISHISLGRANEDPTEFQCAIDLLRPIRDTLPRCRIDLAQALNQLAIPLEPHRRELLQTEVLEIAERSLQDSPDDPFLQHLLGQVSHNLGLLYFQTGRLHLADQFIQRAQIVLSKLVSTHEGVFEYQNSLAECLSVQATIFFAQNNAEQGEQLMDRSTEIRKLLVARYPNVPSMEETLSRSFQTHAALLIQSGQLESAEKLARNGVATAEQVNRKSPSKYNQYLIAASTTLLATAQCAMKQETLAIDSFKKSCDTLEELMEKYPSELSYQIEAGVTFMNFSNVLRTNSPEQALQYGDRSVELLSKTYHQFSLRTDLRSYLFNAIGARAQTLETLRNYCDAADAWNQAIKLADSDPAMRDFLQLSFAISSARCGRFKDAEEAGKQLLMKEKLDGASQYNLACLFGILSASQDTEQDSKNLQNIAFQMLNRLETITFLKQAGMLDQLDSDTDLAALRKDPRFQALLNQVRSVTDTKASAENGK